MMNETSSPTYGATPSRKRGKVLFVANTAEFFVSHRLSLALHARACGYEVALACPPGAELSKVHDAGIRHLAIPLDRWGANPLRELRTLLALLALYRREHPDLVHHITIKPVIYGSIAARLAQVPAVVNAITGMGLVYSSHGMGATLRRLVVTALYRGALRHPNLTVIVQNRDDREFLARYRIVDERSVAVLAGAGVDPGNFVRAPEPAGPPLVVVPARLLRSKGIVEFVEAVRLLRDRTEARFALVGAPVPGAPDEIAPELLDAWEREKVVEMWGHRTDMPAVFTGAHIVCLPSYREGMPRALVEAALVGRALVATDVQGCRDLITDGENGILVAPRSPRALADALLRLIEDPQLRARYAQAIYERVRERFTLESVLGETMKIYHTLLECQSAPSPSGVAKK